MFDRFTDSARKVVILAQEEARSLSHRTIGTEHLLVALFVEGDGVAYQALSSMGLKQEDFRAMMENLKGAGEGGSAGHIPFSPRAKKVLELSLREALTLAHNYIGTEHILLGILRENGSTASQMLIALNIDQQLLRNKIIDLLSSTSTSFTNDEEDLLSSHPSGKVIDKRAKNLTSYGTDLTQKARDGELDPVIGRESEIERVIQILSRRTKNNPILIGEPGVGKTAIAEGLAQAIIDGNVPKGLKDSTLFSVDLSALIAGARYRGDFEERFKKLLEEVDSKKNVILFFDEIHALIGAGGSDGSVDAANMMKPLLSRGSLKTMGATTYDEYRKKFSKDTAMVRRFQTVDVNPPTQEDTIKILQGLKKNYEKYHNAIITDEAIIAATKLSDRYISDRFLPDKAIDLIDEAGARARVAAKDNTEDEIVVDAELVAQVVSLWTGVPLTQLTTEETKKYTQLESLLESSVIGQPSAVTSIAKSVRRSKSGLKDPNRPAGSFIFAGPTGVGKTQLAKTLAKALFGSEEALVTYDMSEYMEKHTVSRLIGSPPGYIGHDEGGQLTERVRRSPFSVILFDEIEKAHPDIFNTFLQILEEGRLTDSQGRKVDFRNTYIIMTTNLGAKELVKSNSLGFANSTESGHERLVQAVNNELKQHFRPEFLNRVDDVVVFNQLNFENICNIVDIQIGSLEVKLHALNLGLETTQGAKEYLAKKGFDPTLGVRPLKRVIQNLIEDQLSEMILSGTLEANSVIVVDVLDNKLLFAVRPGVILPVEQPNFQE
jgi:ATP-dependent Clp protease ATP-binding subunit ClpC